MVKKFKFTKDYRRDRDKIYNMAIKLEDELYEKGEYILSLRNQNKSLQNQLETKQNQLEAKEEENLRLMKELAHYKALSNHDGTNTGIPTSQTPINKKKLFQIQGKQVIGI